MKKNPSRRDLLSLATLSFLTGCGGGGGGSATPAATASATDPAAGNAATAGVGTGGTGTGTNNTAYAAGPIAGFGSIIVNGVRYDDSSARISDDSGTLRRVDDLRLGMTVEIRSSSSTTDAQGVVRAIASQIVVSRSITGPVTAVDTAAGTITVLGQTVLVTATTIFDGVAGLAGLMAGQIVEVHALPDAQGRQVATRIERKDSTSFDGILRVSGVIASLNAARTEFKIGAVTITLSGSLAPLAAGLNNGSAVQVEARATSTANVLAAVSVRARSSGLVEGAGSACIEGFVTAFTSAASFSVNGTPVVTNATTVVEGGTLASVALGVRVEVEGTIAAGILTATKVEIKTEDGRSASSGSGSSSGNASGNASGGSSTPSTSASSDFELHGAVTSVDAAAKRLVLRGLTITWDANTEFRDGTVALLVVGRNVEVRGVRASDGTSLRAVRIKFES